MKCHVPQISWHNRDPVLSVDFQMCQNNINRLATAGTDAHVLIWLITLKANGSTSLEFASDLNRHTKTVNIVRFSPNGEILASGDDEAIIILWKQQKDVAADIYNEEDSQNKEHWSAHKVLRGHLDDVCDISWSANSMFLISGSVDNTAIMWNVQKGKNMGLLKDPKGFVQGVTWDPLHQHVATLSSDRILRIYNLHNKRVVCKVQKINTPSGVDKDKQPSKSTRIFYDDTLKSFCRRLAFSPDGEMLIVPSGIIELEEGKFTNTTYVFSRNSFSKPVLHLLTGSKYTIAVRCCPIYFELVPKKDSNKGTEPWEKYDSLWSLPYRMVFAVATQDSVLIYDTQHTLPLAYVTNIHYTHLTDLAWSSDGRCLIASSTDGYCSFITFCENELGIPYTKEKEDSTVNERKPTEKPEEALSGEISDQPLAKEVTEKINKMYTPEGSPCTPKQEKIETRKPFQWKFSPNSSNSPPLNLQPKEAKTVTSKGKKVGHRIQFITLSTPQKLKHNWEVTEKPDERKETVVSTETSNQPVTKDKREKLNNTNTLDGFFTPKQEKATTALVRQEEGLESHTTTQGKAEVGRCTPKEPFQWKLSLEDSSSSPPALQQTETETGGISKGRKAGRRIQFVTLSTPKRKAVLKPSTDPAMHEKESQEDS